MTPEDLPGLTLQALRESLAAALGERAALAFDLDVDGDRPIEESRAGKRADPCAR